MFKRFTGRARKVLQLANQEAQRFNHKYIGLEHVLMALVKEGSGIAALALTEVGLNLRLIRSEVEKLAPYGPETIIMGKLPQTPQLESAILRSKSLARKMKDRSVDTEHLLLTIIEDTEGITATVLNSLQVEKQRVINAVKALMDARENDEITVKPIMVQNDCKWPEIHGWENGLAA